jgi:hypothetical protein
LPARRLATAAGLRILDAARAALATRYREFYGFNHGDARRTIEVDGGRGIRIHVFGLPPPRRLPLRAGTAFLVSRNGIPIGYGDGFILFERVDLSFNVFPEYRDGETAFVFARLLRAYRRTFGVTVFSIDPYQVGFRNEEAIESGRASGLSPPRFSAPFRRCRESRPPGRGPHRKDADTEARRACCGGSPGPA